MDEAARQDDGIRGLGMIGDRRTAALLDREGAIVWYCPQRFDRPSLFAALLDAEGGAWRIHVPGARSARRRYLAASGIIETVFRAGGAESTVTDFMPAGQGAPAGLLCRRFAAMPGGMRSVLQPRPDYAREPVRLVSRETTVLIQERWHLHASHPLRVAGDTVHLDLPPGTDGWAVLSDLPLAPFGTAQVDAWLAATLAYWHALSAGDSRNGPYQREMADSLRALRLLTHEASGGILAAATTSLPEVPGGQANWDYRYVWLRDAGMIVSALLRASGDLAEGERYLGFICSSRGRSSHYPVPVFADLDSVRAPRESSLMLAGYRGSRPVRVGNGARDQLQLDGFGNVLLAAKLIYQRSDARPHWDTVAAIADFLSSHWHEPDHGIWEEPVTRQYTVGKVIAACGLDSVAEFSPDRGQARRWRAAVQDIRAFVASHCLTSEGAYAAYAGSEAVDVSAALFPVWAYCRPDTSEMLATMAALERDCSFRGELYWRHLECTDSGKEGAFLAATFWVAQYWVMRGAWDRVRRILDAGLAFANDLGLFAEEGDPRTGLMQGNFPQAFVHAAFIGVVTDLMTARANGMPPPQDMHRGSGCQ